MSSGTLDVLLQSLEPIAVKTYNAYTTSAYAVHPEVDQRSLQTIANAALLNTLKEDDEGKIDIRERAARVVPVDAMKNLDVLLCDIESASQIAVSALTDIVQQYIDPAASNYPRNAAKIITRNILIKALSAAS